MKEGQENILTYNSRKDENSKYLIIIGHVINRFSRAIRKPRDPQCWIVLCS